MYFWNFIKMLNQVLEFGRNFFGLPSSKCVRWKSSKSTIQLGYSCQLYPMYAQGHLKESHDKLQNEVTNYRNFHENIRCKLEEVLERLEEETTFEDLTTKNFYAL